MTKVTVSTMVELAVEALVVVKVVV